MRLFSQRKGIKPVKSVMQVDSMDEELKNGLWNALSIFYWTKVKAPEWSGYYPQDEIKTLIKILWLDYFKKPLDTLHLIWQETYEKLREYFFKCQWYEVYDFIEFVANNYPKDHNQTNQKFMDYCNFILERELSAYRFVGGKITQITSELEISEIEEASEIPLKAVNIHLKRALDLLSDRKYPDYRNSIKESISAVEALCNLIVKEKNTTLGKVLEKIEEKVPLHPALKKAFSSLYGYTSNAEGIRHALLDEPNLSFEDAKFMLVSCSAFINYLMNKTQKAEIKI